jgi:hypothetical protein
MKISPLNPAGAGQDARECRAASEAHQARWRTELELAQWQSRLRYRREPGDGQRTAETATDSVAVANLPPTASGPLRAGADLRPVAGRPAATGLDAVQPQAPHRPAAVVQPSFVASGEVATAVAADVLRAGTLAARAPMVAPKAALPLPFEHFQWPATASHVFLQGNRLNVALRDPHIDEQDWPALRDRIQAQCGAWGLELAELTINGKRIGPVGPARD